mgnify:CR=1 FL=1
MTVILGYLEIMRINGDKEDEMLLKVEQKAKRVMELINQFFTLAKLEAGDMELEISRINICEVCRENILDFYELLKQKEFQVEVKIPEEAVFIMGNKEALHRILYNLISNVIRYGLDGRYLGLVLRSVKNDVYIDVIDKGKGIEKEFAGNVLSDCLQWRIPETEGFRGMVWGLRSRRLLHSSSVERLCWRVNRM